MKISKIHHQPSPPPFDPAARIARKYRVSIATGRLIAELAGIGGQREHHHESLVANVGGAR